MTVTQKVRQLRLASDTRDEDVAKWLAEVLKSAGVDASNSTGEYLTRNATVTVRLRGGLVNIALTTLCHDEEE